MSGAISDHYGVSLTAATALFSYLTTGVLIGSLLSIVANPALGSKTVILISGAVLAATIVALRLVDQAGFLPIAFVVIGTSCGLMLASAAIVLTAIYSERHRPSALLATDSSYSFAGFVATPLAGIVVAQSMHWTYAYGFALAVTLTIMGIGVFVKYPEELKADEDAPAAQTRWPLSVYLVGGAMVVYLICFIFVYSWTPAHAAAAFGVAADEAGDIVSRYFLGLLLGQIIAFFIALKIDVRLLIAISGAGATLVSSGIWLSDSASQLGLALLAYGFIAGGLLKPLIAYGTQVLPHPTSRLVGFYMLCMAIGSSISPALGAYIVEMSDIETVLQFITVGLVLTVALIYSSFYLSRRQFGG